MIKQWLESQAARYLADRGFFVLKASVPQLIISYGVGTMQRHEDGSISYMIRMPKGHQLITLLNTMLSEPSEL